MSDISRLKFLATYPGGLNLEFRHDGYTVRFVEGARFTAEILSDAIYKAENWICKEGHSDNLDEAMLTIRATYAMYLAG